MPLRVFLARSELGFSSACIIELNWTMWISEVKDKHRTVPPFSLPLFIFVRVVFSVLQCITWHYPSKFELQSISWKQFGTERSCQADKTLPLSFTLKCGFFLTSKIHKAAKLLTCVRGAVKSHILSCPSMQNSPLFI